MVPAPPVLVPRKRPAPLVLDADVARDPAQVRRAHGVPDGSHATRALQQRANDGVAPAQGKQRVVRPRAARITGPAQERSDGRPNPFRLAARKESLQDHEAVLDEARSRTWDGAVYKGRRHQSDCPVQLCGATTNRRSRYAGSPSWRRISCWTSRRSSSKNRPIGRTPCRTRPRREVVRRPRRGAAIRRPRPARRHACSCRKWAGPRVFFPQCGQMRTLNAACFLRFTFGISPPGWTEAHLPLSRATASAAAGPHRSARGPPSHLVRHRRSGSALSRCLHGILGSDARLVDGRGPRGVRGQQGRDASRSGPQKWSRPVSSP
jgi:hypothetical protein